MDGTVLAFGVGITLLTILLVGLVPAFQATEAAVASGLREGGRGRTAIRSGVRMCGGLVVAELALAVLLLSGAGLLGLLYEVSPTDPATIGTMAALLLLVAIVASWLPARRAARVDPMTVLRHE